jgi:choline transport protein
MQEEWYVFEGTRSWTEPDEKQSYTVGTINMFGWVAICAGICIIMPQIIMGIVVFYNNSFVIERWHSFLIYQGLNVSVLVYNLFILPKAAWTHNIGCLYFCLCI